jgi:hypothetical protein
MSAARFSSLGNRQRRRTNATPRATFDSTLDSAAAIPALRHSPSQADRIAQRVRELEEEDEEMQAQALFQRHRNNNRSDRRRRFDDYDNADNDDYRRDRRRRDRDDRHVLCYPPSCFPSVGSVMVYPPISSSLPRYLWSPPSCVLPPSNACLPF